MTKRTETLVAIVVCLAIFSMLALLANLGNNQQPIQNYVRPLPNHEWFLSQRDTHQILVRHHLSDTDKLRCQRIAAEYNKYAQRVNPTSYAGLPNYLSEEAC